MQNSPYETLSFVTLVLNVFGFKCNPAKNCMRGVHPGFQFALHYRAPNFTLDVPSSVIYNLYGYNPHRQM